MPNKRYVFISEPKRTKATDINEDNTFVIWDPLKRQCLAGRDAGVYIWTSVPWDAWCFTNNPGAANAVMNEMELRELDSCLGNAVLTRRQVTAILARKEVARA